MNPCSRLHLFPNTRCILLAGMLGVSDCCLGAAPLQTLRVAENHRFLVTASGRSLFWLADTAWQLIHDLGEAEMRPYFTDRCNHVLDGCLFRHVSPWGTHHCTGARNYYWGGRRSIAQPGKRAGERFTDPANGNFQLKPGSVSINVGAAIPGLNDAGSASPFAGSARDLAACEFGGKNWSAGATMAPAAFQSNMINSK